MVKVMSYLVWPFIVSLVLISIAVIHYWTYTVHHQVDLSSLAAYGYHCSRSACCVEM
ncbi:L-threonine/L-serine transporter [Escherichia coli]|nr:L-threonine/L-serine transporter [Escherichia coli]